MSPAEWWALACAILLIFAFESRAKARASEVRAERAERNWNMAATSAEANQAGLDQAESELEELRAKVRAVRGILGDE